MANATAGKESEIRLTLTALAATPKQITRITRGRTEHELLRKPAPESWSARDIVAHLRACAEVWGRSIERMLAEDHPTIRYVSPRGWIKSTIYLSQSFHDSLRELKQHEPAWSTRSAHSTPPAGLVGQRSREPRWGATRLSSATRSASLITKCISRPTATDPRNIKNPKGLANQLGRLHHACGRHGSTADRARRKRDGWHRAGLVSRWQADRVFRAGRQVRGDLHLRCQWRQSPAIRARTERRGLPSTPPHDDTLAAALAIAPRVRTKEWSMTASRREFMLGAAGLGGTLQAPSGRRPVLSAAIETH